MLGSVDALRTFSAWHIPIDTALSGESGSALRSDQLFFSSSSNTAQLCIHHQDDTVPCEPNITGIVYLDGSDLVAIGHPNSAQVTVQDDDCKYYMI